MSLAQHLPAASTPDSTASSATRAQIAAWIALIGIVFALYLRGVGSFQVGIYQDDAIYIVLARSLAAGDRFGLINDPGPPPPAKYPFMFPLLLAPVTRLFPDTLLASTVVPLVATLFNLSLLFSGWPLLSPSTSRWWGLGVALLHGLSPLVVDHSRMVMSEPVFTTFVLAGLLLTEACARRQQPDSRRSIAPSLALGVTLAAAFFTRPIGIAICGASLLRLIVAKRGKELAGVFVGSVGLVVLVLAATPVKLRQLPPWGYTGELKYTHHLTFLDQRQQVAADYAFLEIRKSILPVGGGDRERAAIQRLGLEHGPEIIGAAITAVMVIGAWRALLAAALSPTALLFELFYLGVLLLWPWAAIRFLYPVQPFVCFQFLFGLAWIASRIAATRRGGTAGYFGGVTAALAWGALVVVSSWKSSKVEDSSKFTRDLRVGTAWVEAHSPTQAILMARYPQAVYLYSKRKTVDLPAVTSAAAFDRVLSEERIGYVLLGPTLNWGADEPLTYKDAERDLLQVLAELAARGRVELVYESEPWQKVLVYRVKE